MNERTAVASMEAVKRVIAARNNVMAASTGLLDPAMARDLIVGAVLLLDAAAEWLTEGE